MNSDLAIQNSLKVPKLPASVSFDTLPSVSPTLFIQAISMYFHAHFLNPCTPVLFHLIRGNLTPMHVTVHHCVVVFVETS